VDFKLPPDRRNTTTRTNEKFAEVLLANPEMQTKPQQQEGPNSLGGGTQVGAARQASTAGFLR
jgi:hypothetical protein